MHEREQSEKKSEHTQDPAGPFFQHEKVMQKNGREVRIKFNLVVHTPEFVGAIAESLHDADVVAVECATPDSVYRNSLTAMANLITQPGDSSAKSIAISIFEHRRPKDFFDDLVLHFQGTGKKIVLVDTTGGEREFDLAERALREGARALQEKYFVVPLPQTSSALYDMIKLWSDMLRLRDEMVAKQVEDVIDSMPAGDKPLEIGVVQGSMHGATSRMVSARKQEYMVSRIFIPEIPSDIVPGKMNPKVPFDYFEEAVRRVRFFPERELPPVFLEKVLLSFYFDDVIMDAIGGGGADIYKRGYLSRKIVDDFSDKEGEHAA